MKQLSIILGTLAAVTGMLACALPSSAQVYASNYGGLADVSYANGGATIVRADSGAQVGATMNAPLAPGDYFASGPGAAEVQFDGNSMLRLASNSQIRIVNVSPGSREVQVAAGTVELAELTGAGGAPQIDTPTLTLRPQRSGDYRVTVYGNGETLVTVRRGAATVSTANGTQTLTPGSTLVSNGGYTNFRNALGFDSFDQFNASRDQSAVNAYNADPYLSPDLAGYSDLANYGQWQNVPGYGYSWAPSNQVADNFAPYQNGQWVWEPGYGYTWVDNAPYGYETTHYGSWFYNNNYGGWLWQPPGYQYQTSSQTLASIFIPAAVSFFLNGGNGTDLSSLLSNGLASNLIGAQNADIGWIPLAPGEVYQPWYGQGYAYPTTVYYAVPNVTNIYNYYTNAQYYHGVAMVPISAWRGGNFSHRYYPERGRLRRIVLIRGAVPITPTTSNLFVRAEAPQRTIVLSQQFRTPRLEARVASIPARSFAEQRSRMATITRIHTKVEAFHAPAARIAPTMYHPAERAQMKFIAPRPMPPLHAQVRAQAKTQMHVAPVEQHHAVTPQIEHHAVAAPAPQHRMVTPQIEHHVVTPQVEHHAVAAPVVHHAAMPQVERPIAPQVQHHVAPQVQRQVAPPVERPVTHPVAPQVERPVAHPVAPQLERPVAPAAHPRPEKPASTGKPEKPNAKPTSRPNRG